MTDRAIYPTETEMADAAQACADALLSVVALSIPPSERSAEACIEGAMKAMAEVIVRTYGEGAKPR